MYDYKTAIRINRLLIIVLILGAIGFVLSSTESRQINRMMNGVKLDTSRITEDDPLTIRIHGTINKNLITGVNFKGVMFIEGEEYTVKRREVLKANSGSNEVLGEIYFDKEITHLAILVNGWHSGEGNLIVAPAIDHEDAIEVANAVLFDYFERNRIKPLN